MNNEVLVAGDVVLDQHIYEGSRHEYSDGLSRGVHVEEEPGGAAIVDRLLRAVFASGPSADRWQSCLAVNASAHIAQGNDSRKAYAVWRPYPKKSTPDKQVWRVRDAMGFGSMVRQQNEETPWPAADNLPADPRIVVLSDGGMGFRRRDHWAKLPFDKADWIVLKTAAPLMEGDLWNELSKEKHRQKLILIASAWAVRQSMARLCEGLSWDETVESLLNELRPDRTLSALMHCRHLIISFDSEGVMWLDRQPSDGADANLGHVHLIYAAGWIEGDHERETEGKTFGLMSCLTASVVETITRNLKPADVETALESGIESGLAAMRDLRDNGHGPILEHAYGFPADRLARTIKKPGWRCARAGFPFPPAPASIDNRPSSWSILRESQRPWLDAVRKGETPAAYKLARLCVLRGSIAFQNLPHLQIENLLAVDRREIEALRTLAKVIQRYKDHDKGTKPLSLGVFGPPGAGKSFAVKELANKYCRKDGWMEFNLSQFATPDDLIGAFHQIRDKVLSQLHNSDVLPTAFFDEFDTRKYHWLPYLLAPMQDGAFQDGQIKHPIGKCVLIFAGGTSPTFGDFGPRRMHPETPEYVEFKLAKGPDFKSRLDGYYDVVGPNQRRGAQEGDPDIFFPLRRALMVRSELKCAEDDKLDLDEGVLNALLKVKQFEHASRSLGKILQPFEAECSKARMQGTHLPRLVRSLLPPLSQLEMHTDAAEFLKLLAEPTDPLAYTIQTASGDDKLPSSGPITEVDVKQLGPAIHKTYEVAAALADRGYVKTPFESIGDFKQESNYAAARRMIRILNLISLDIVDGEATPTEERTVGEYLEYHLELLAEAEHDGWMRWHFNQGWRYAKEKDGKTKDEARKTHSLLVPYLKLDHFQKNKDRATIRTYPDFVKHLEKVKKIRFRQAATPPPAGT